MMRGRTMIRWPGHAEVTESALRILLERAVAGESEFSWSERVLTTACEFWAAAMARCLADHLGSEPDGRLWLAEVAFAEIGVADVASALRLARHDLAADERTDALVIVATRLELTLDPFFPAADACIADFARKLIALDAARPGSAERPS